MFVDSHCHLDRIDLDPFDNDFAQLIDRCDSANIEHMLCVCIDLEHYPAMRDLVDAYPQVSVSAGVHPMADRTHDAQADTIARMADDERVVAIGETGLDYYYCRDDRNSQRQRFREHVRAAVACNKPLIVHTRDAGDDTLAILEEEGADGCGGVIHCFTETAEFADRAMQLGFMISFSGIITFASADALREVARTIPEDRLLIETDSPYLAPVPHRGRQNWPSLVTHVADCIADLRGCTTGHIAVLSAGNYYRVFGAPPRG